MLWHHQQQISGKWIYQGSSPVTPLSRDQLLKEEKFAAKGTNSSLKSLNPIALRKAKIVYNFGLSECSRAKEEKIFPEESTSFEERLFLRFCCILFAFLLSGRANSFLQE